MPAACASAEVNPVRPASRVTNLTPAEFSIPGNCACCPAKLTPTTRPNLLAPVAKAEYMGSPVTLLITVALSPAAKTFSIDVRPV